MKHQLLHATLLFLANSLLPAAVGAQIIAVGGSHSLAMCPDGTVWSWGWNYYDQLGHGTISQSTVPVEVNGLSGAGIISISGGNSHSLALTNNGTVWAWGWNNYGQLGDGTSGGNGCSCIGNPNCCHQLAAQVGGLADIISVAAGMFNSLALRNDGTVWAWGHGLYGQLGNGTTADEHAPVQVSPVFGGSITAIAEGSYHALALKNDSTVWAWGKNYNGEIGDGTNIQRNTPVQVISLSGVVAIAAGGSTGGGFSLALKVDGSVWAWGLNSSGQLGDGTGLSQWTPVLVSGLTGITAIGAGIGHSIALKNDGTLWAWGNNAYSQLGNGTINQYTPVPVDPAYGGNITAIATRWTHSVALKDDGSLWAWGHNDKGQLGDGTTIDRSTPIQVVLLCEIATDVAGVPEPSSVTVIPNPTIGKFIINGPEGFGTTSLEIRNVIGQEVLRSTFNGTRSEIDLTSQPSGVYFLTIRTAGQVISRRVIKE